MTEAGKKTVERWAAGIATATLIAFAIVLFITKQNQNIATWACWTVMDFVIFWGMRKGPKGNEDSWLMFGYGIGALAVTLALLSTGSWAWGPMEWGILLACTVCILCLTVVNAPETSIVIATATMWIAGSGILMSMWQMPRVGDAWFWGLCAIASFLTLLPVRTFSIQGALIPVASTTFNLLVFVLILR